MQTITAKFNTIHEQVKYNNLIIIQTTGKVENKSSSLYVRYSYDNSVHVFNFKMN